MDIFPEIYNFLCFFLVEAGFSKQPIISHSREFLRAPAEYAYPSDQGKLFTCTRHALGKAIVDGFQKKIFRKVLLSNSGSNVKCNLKTRP